ncbi:serpin family protein [Cytophaga aurantiaca]|uniref:serpin family protein n=1 Tax=Cytophaga aurantiaca TaxID=29530 RepID=UPI0012F818B0|nr:serpin family protein [Cytophaga aurantiaca]
MLFISSNAQSINKTVIGNTDFAFELFKQAFKKDTSICISPYSISFALSMAYAGARNETKVQMQNILHFEGDQEKSNEAFAEIQRRLNLFKGDTSIRLAMANAIWKRDEEKVHQQYIDLLYKYYNASVYPITNAAAVNEWVKAKTKNKIDNIITDPALAQTQVLLTNAIYFKGNWLYEFDEKNTRKDTFSVNRNKKNIVDMMYQKHNFNYYHDDYSQVLEMPYKGNELSIIIVLPKEKYTLADIIENMSAQTFGDYRFGLAEQKVNVYLPKFTFAADFELSNELKQMGLTDPFTYGADFSGVAPKGLFISKVVHKTFIAVNEKGSEAAAVTSVSMIRSVEAKPIEFNANKPFLFLIVDKQTETILFMGSVVNPTEVNGKDVKVYTGPRTNNGGMPPNVGY